MNSVTILADQGTNETKWELIQKLIPRKQVDPRVFDSLPKMCPHAEKFQNQRQELGGYLLIDKLASYVGQTLILQRHFPFQNKDDIKKLYHCLWPSCFSDPHSTVLGHLLTLYILLCASEENDVAEKYLVIHRIPYSLQSLVKAYRFFDHGLYQEFTSNLSSYVSYQQHSIKEMAKLDSQSYTLMFKHLLKVKEYKAAFLFVESFGIEYDSKDALEMLFHYDFHSCRRFVQSHLECLPSFIELCILPNHEDLTKKLLTLPFSTTELAHLCVYVNDHLSHSRFTNVLFLLLYVHHSYALAIYLHSFLPLDSFIHMRKPLVDAMQLKLTQEEKFQLCQFQQEKSFLKACSILKVSLNHPPSTSRFNALTSSSFSSSSSSSSSLSSSSSSFEKAVPMTFKTTMRSSIESPFLNPKKTLVFRPKPFSSSSFSSSSPSTVTLSDLQLKKSTPPPPLQETPRTKLKKIKFMNRQFLHRKKKRKQMYEEEDKKEMDEDMEKKMEGSDSEEEGPRRESTLPMEESDGKEKEGDEVTSMTNARYLLRNRKHKESAEA